MKRKRLSDIKRSEEEYDLKSRRRLEMNLERKFKKMFGAALYHFETLLCDEIERNPDLHKDFRSEVLRVGNRLIQNMKKELSCYNVTYIPVSFELKGPESDER